MAQIGIVVDFNDARAGSQLDQLKAKLVGLQSEQARLNATTFNAFSRAQIAPQIAALNELQASVKKVIAEVQVMNSTVSGPANLQGFINGLVGADRQIKSAASSARILKTSLSDLAVGDAAGRDAALSYAKAQQDTITAINARAAATRAAQATSAAAMEAEYARLESRYASRASRTLPPVSQVQGPGISSNPEAEIERLSKEVIQKGQLLASTVGQSMELEATKGLEQAVSKARNRIAELNAGGAQASGAAYEQFSQSETAAARAQLNANLVKDAGTLFAEIKKTEAAMHSTASASVGITQGIRSATNESRVLQKEIAHLPAIFDTAMRGNTRQMLSSFGAALRDAGTGTTGLLVGLGGIAAIGAVEGVVRSLERWNVEVSELAEKQTNFAGAVGMSAMEFSNFSTAMKLVGGNADTAARALEVVQKKMEEAVQNPTSGPATAFLKLGLSWDELKKHLEDPGGVENVLRELASAYVRLGDTAERTAVFLQIAGGRSQLAQLVPILRNGAEGFDELMQKAAAANQNFAGNITKLAEIAGKIHELDTAWGDFKAHVVSSDIFGKELENLTSLVKELNGVKAFDFGRLSPAVQLGRMFGQMQSPITMGNPFGSGGALGPSGMQPGGALLSDPMNKLATVSNELAAAFQATVAATGYKVGVTGGHAEGGHVKDSQHYTDTGALDFNIFDQLGNKIGHDAAQHMGSSAAQAYINFGEVFKKLTPGAGRSGMDFNDPGHVDLGLLNGASPGKLSGRLQSGIMPSYGAPPGQQATASAASSAPSIVPEGDLAADEKLYMARLKYGEEVAKNLNQQSTLNALLAKAAAYESMPQGQKTETLLKEVNLTKEQAESQAKLLGIYQQQWTANKDQASMAEKVAMAQNQSAQITARGREDAKALVDLEMQRAKIVASNPYSDEAQKIEAGNQILQARINLEKQNLQTLEKIISTQEQISNSVIKQAEASNAAGVGKKGNSGAAYTADISVVKEQYDIQVQLIQQEIALAQAKKDTTAETSAQLKLLTTIENEQTKITELQKKMADEVKAANDKAIAPLKSFFSSAGSAFEGFLDAAIGKTETFSKAIQKLGTGLIKDAVKGLGNVASESIAGSFGGKAGEGISGLLADKLGSAIGLTKAVPKATGDAALTSSSASVTASLQALNSAILQTTGALTTHSAATTGNTTAQTLSTTAKTTDTGAQVLNTTGKATNSLAMTTDTAAVQANALAQTSSAATGGIASFFKAIPIIGGLFKEGGIVPSAAGGMIVGGSALAGGGQMSILHPNEMVLPAPISRGLQSMISQGGGGNTFAPNLAYNTNMTGYHPYRSQSDFEGALRMHGNTLMNHVTNLLRNGWRP